MGNLPVPGAFAHYDATVGVTDAGGGAVSTWADQSGHGRNLSQSTAVSRPITGTHTQNGLNVLYFDGVNDMLQSAPLAAQNQPFTLFVVAKANTLTGNPLLKGLGLNGPEIGIESSVPAWNLWAGSSTTFPIGGTADTNPHIFSAVFNGPSSNLQVDGTFIVAGDPGPYGLGSNESIYIGGYAGFTQCWNGWIGEVVIYPSALNISDRKSTEGYLIAKWLPMLAPHSPILYDKVDRRSWVSAPQFMRQRHRYRGHRESFKVNSETHGFTLDVRKLYERYTTLEDQFQNRFYVMVSGGTIPASYNWFTPSTSGSLIPLGTDALTLRAERLRNRIRDLEA